MRVYWDKLSQQVQQGLPPVIMLFGDEQFQLQQALDQIRQAAKAQGCEERVRFTHDNQFNWQLLFDEAQALSLFATRKLIEVEIANGKPGKEGSAQLNAWAELPNNEHILLLWGGKIEKAQTNSKWFKTLDKLGWFVPVYEIDSQRLPQWLRNQCQQAGVQITPNAINLMTQMFEGNLLSAAQEITRLALLYPNQTVDEEHIRDAVSDQSRFSVFQLADDLLQGNFAKAIHILERLQGEELEPVIISWALQKEADLLVQLHLAQQQGQNLKQAFSQLRIWDKRQPLYQKALQRLDLARLKALSSALADFDLAYKSQGMSYPYTQIAHCCALFTGSEQLARFNQMMQETN
ncbi:DNA polymerase III subunit delta [Catenovulum sp. SM1970]|uniref:DNA polymerase III subunit delta n=1 Tax=Marinifaba aquimaris TaxID=2741323 RepID=UPI00157248AB|nr:DNA polymerase III subunit delta [Marinifaba aquimaris]NTS78413.1 DNA polymerase III subunit delta [Marinifaba aquimaris]